VVVDVINEVENRASIGIVIVVSVIVEARHQRVRDGSRDTDARDCWGSAVNSLSGTFHVAFAGGHARGEIFGDRFEI
jgi:hypothetical protein